MKSFLENEYQSTKVCDDEEFRRILNLHDLQHTEKDEAVLRIRPKNKSYELDSNR